MGNLLTITIPSDLAIVIYIGILVMTYVFTQILNKKIKDKPKPKKATIFFKSGNKAYLNVYDFYMTIDGLVRNIHIDWADDKVGKWMFEADEIEFYIVEEI